MSQPQLKASEPAVPQHVAEALLRIGGANEYGEPLLRLVHGCYATHFRLGQQRLKYAIVQRKLIGWDLYYQGKRSYWPGTAQPKVIPVGGLLQPRYDFQEEGFPGWVLERWCPPEIVCRNWEEHRYVRDQYGSIKTDGNGNKLDLLGPAPACGQYRWLMWCVDADEQPMDVTDFRIIDVAARARQAVEDEGSADYWRSLLPVEKATRLAARRREADEAEQAAIDEEFESLVGGIFTHEVKKYDGKARAWSLPNN